MKRSSRRLSPIGAARRRASEKLGDAASGSRSSATKHSTAGEHAEDSSKRAADAAKRVKGAGTDVKESGVRFSRAELYRSAFGETVTRHLASEGVDIEKMGVFTVDEFVGTVRKSALRNLKTALTVSVWQGDYTQLAGTNHPFGASMLQALAWEFTTGANQLVTEGRTGFFVDGLFNEVPVESCFTDRRQAEDVRIRRKGSSTLGVKYVDRAELWGNTEGQHLFHSGEFKQAGGRGLTEQIAARNERLEKIAHLDDMELTFLEQGKRQTLDLAQLVLMRGEGHFKSRISMQAGRYLRAKWATDAAGDPYVRLIVPLSSAAVRRVLTKVHSDKSWQK
jgi:hypothetical protein